MLRFNLIVAVCENFGIGNKGELPWRLKSELKYFSSTTKRVRDVKNHNVVIMGKRTYFGVPSSNRPLAGRLNVVLSSTLQPNELPENVLLYSNLESAMQGLERKQNIENVWIVGGNGVYQEAMTSPRCHRLYITKIKAHYDCDTFFPAIPADFKEVRLDAETPADEQEENGVKFEYKIYERQYKE